MGVRSYEDLAVWRAAMGLVNEIYGATTAFPAGERFGLVSQMRRAAVSVPANIAEGHGRLHRGDFVHHLSIASGSLRELETHVHIAKGQGFLPPPAAAALLAQCRPVGVMLRVMRRRLGAPH